ncbi:MAG: Fur family transcriptional regulator [Desulfomonilaceae bacterium]
MTEPKLKMTKQRRVIVEELKKLKTHPTATALYEIVRKRLPRISLGTVYRNLDLLAEAGIIQKLETAGTQKRFDGTVENHYHVRCVQCGQVDDLPLPLLRDIEDVLHGLSNYKILSHRLEFQGVCPSCQVDGTR